jgi:hypothetical protein
VNVLEKYKGGVINMRYLISIMVAFAFCVPVRAEILIFKTSTGGQQFDVANKVVEQKKESGYLVINADLSNPNSVTVSETQFLHYETKTGRKIQYTTLPSGAELILVDYNKSKKMILRLFDDTTGTYMVLNGNASLKDIGGLSRFIATGLSGNDVWQQQDYMTGSGSIRMTLDLKATKSANIQSKTVTQLIESYEQLLEQTKGYIPE